MRRDEATVEYDAAAPGYDVDLGDGFRVEAPGAAFRPLRRVRLAELVSWVRVALGWGERGGFEIGRLWALLRETEPTPVLWRSWPTFERAIDDAVALGQVRLLDGRLFLPTPIDWREAIP